MDLEDNNLILLDPIDEKILNRQPITSIRVWGVGRDNGRYDHKRQFLNFFLCTQNKLTKLQINS